MDRAARPFATLGSDGAVWQGFWDQFVDQLADDKCVDLLRSMGLTVPGFRKGAKKIPIHTVRSTLKAAPARRGGKPFLQWFRKSFEDLVTDFESLTDEEVSERQDHYFETYPVQIVAIALSMMRPDLLEAWQPALDDRAARQQETEARETLDALRKQVQSLKTELQSRVAELEQCKSRQASADVARRKLERQVEQLTSRLEKSEEDARKAIKDLRLEAKSAAEQRDDAVAKNVDLEDRIAKYREARRQNESLFRLYRSLSGHANGTGDADSDDCQRVLIIGDTFPVQLFYGSARCVRVEAVAPPAEVDANFVAQCQVYDKVVLLSSNSHKVRLALYQQLGSDIVEISSLGEFGQVIYEE